MKSGLSFATAILVAVIFISAAPSKHDDIRTMLKVSGSGELGVQVLQQMVDGFKQAIPGAPEEFWEKFKSKANVDSFVEMLVPVYDKHISHDDVRGLIQFYQSPLGKRFVAATPKITEDSMAAGEKWGEQMSQKVMQELKSGGKN